MAGLFGPTSEELIKAQADATTAQGTGISFQAAQLQAQNPFAAAGFLGAEGGARAGAAAVKGAQQAGFGRTEAMQAADKAREIAKLVKTENPDLTGPSLLTKLSQAFIANGLDDQGVALAKAAGDQNKTASEIMENMQQAQKAQQQAMKAEAERLRLGVTETEDALKAHERAREAGDPEAIAATAAAVQSAARGTGLTTIKEGVEGSPGLKRDVVYDRAGNKVIVGKAYDPVTSTTKVEVNALAEFGAKEGIKHISKSIAAAREGLVSGEELYKMEMASDQLTQAMTEGFFSGPVGGMIGKFSQIVGNSGLGLTNTKIMELADNGVKINSAFVDEVLRKMKGLGGSDTERELKMMRDTSVSNQQTPAVLARMAALMKRAIHIHKNTLGNNAKFIKHLAKKVSAGEDADVVSMQGMAYDPAAGSFHDEELNAAAGITPRPSVQELKRLYPEDIVDTTSPVAKIIVPAKFKADTMKLVPGAVDNNDAEWVELHRLQREYLKGNK